MKKFLKNVFGSSLILAVFVLVLNVQNSYAKKASAWVCTSHTEHSHCHNNVQGNGECCPPRDALNDCCFRQ